MLWHQSSCKAFGRHVESFIDEDLRNEKLEALKDTYLMKMTYLDAVKGSNAGSFGLGGSSDGTDKPALWVSKTLSTMGKAACKEL
jgi:hypothetical protein